MPTEPREPSPYDDGALWDVVADDLDYGLDFYVGLARAAGGPVLDIACGTGRILLPCREAGVDIDGLDRSEGMLNQLRNKAAARGWRPPLYQADMASFQLARRYALIMIPFDTFVHNLTPDAQVNCLVGCRAHLQPGGLLAVDTFIPDPAWIAARHNRRVREGRTTHPGTGLPIRGYYTRSFDRGEQLLHSVNEWELLDAAGNVTATHRSRHTTRWIYPHEMERLLQVAGYERWEILGGFDGRPLRPEAVTMIVKAWNC
jgi:SAM-dependent methyltransferase